MENKERYIKEQLQDHESDIDIKGLWGDLESALDQQDKKDRKGAWLFLIPVLILISAFIIAYPYFSKKGESLVSTHNIASAETKTKGPAIIEEKDSQDALSNTEVVTIDQNSQQPGLSEDRLELDNQTDQLKSNDATSKRTEDGNQISNRDVLPGLKNGSSHSHLVLLEDSRFRNANNFTARDNTLIENPSSKSTIKTSALEEVNTVDQVVLNDDIRDYEENLRMLPAQEIYTLDAKEVKCFEDTSMPTKKISIAKKYKWAIEFGGGPLFTKMGYTTMRTNDDAHFKFANKVRQSQKVAPGELYTLSLQRKLGISSLESTRHSLAIRTGLSLIKNSYIFEGFRFYSTDEIISGTKTVVQNVNGTTEIIIGDITRTTTYLQRERKYNSFESFQIPLLLDYEIKLLPKFSVQFNNGLAINKVLTRNYNVRNLVYGIPDLFIEDIEQVASPKLDYFSYIGEVDLNFWVGSRSAIKISAFYSAPLGTLPLEEDLLTSINTYGLKASLRYRL